MKRYIKSSVNIHQNLSEMSYDGKILVDYYIDYPSRYDDKRKVDYMMVNVDGVELYAEEPQDIWSENVRYDLLKQDIIKQAKKYGISKDNLKFYFDKD